MLAETGSDVKLALLRCHVTLVQNPGCPHPLEPKSQLGCVSALCVLCIPVAPSPEPPTTLDLTIKSFAVCIFRFELCNMLDFLLVCCSYGRVLSCSDKFDAAAKSASVGT